MRVCFSKIHCPSFICFCKPPAQQLFVPSPLKLDNAPHVPPPAAAAVVKSDHTVPCDKENEVVGIGGGEKVGEVKERIEVVVLKSIIKKKVVDVEGEVEVEGRKNKKAVQWMDVVGKELVDIKEFESSDTEDTDSESEGSRGCTCSIL